MKKFSLYFVSTLVSILVGYFVNQLPNLPVQLKPWVPAVIAVLVLVTALILIQLAGGEGVTARTVIKGNNLAGKRSMMGASQSCKNILISQE
jgi:hypothetical protein